VYIPKVIQEHVYVDGEKLVRTLSNRISSNTVQRIEEGVDPRDFE
jgi:hypothetical protein